MTAKIHRMTQPNDWCDHELLQAWRQFILVMKRHDVPVEVLAAMVDLDSALFNGHLNEQDHRPGR